MIEPYAVEGWTFQTPAPRGGW